GACHSGCARKRTNLQTMIVPTIYTPRLTLRSLQPADFGPISAILSDRDVLRYMPRSEPFPPELVERIMQRQQKQWDAYGYGWYAVADRQSSQLIGWCGLGVLDETGETEIKYLFKKSHWGRGLATEAAQRCVQDGFEKYGLEQIIGLVHPENSASRHVLDKLGLVYTDRVHFWGLDLDRYVRRRG
ncbi:MAG: GNAT family N-acetyltransferase, partial [Anaerolineales bacterium]